MVEPATGKPVLTVIKGFGIDPFNEGRPVPMATRNIWENGHGPGSQDYWEHGTGIGSRAFWESGVGPGSRDYWERGHGVGSLDFWEEGTGPGSEQFYKYEFKPGTQGYWLYGDGPGSRRYWESGEGPGSRHYWETARALRLAMKSAIQAIKRTKFSSDEQPGNSNSDSVRATLPSLPKFGKRADVSAMAKAAVLAPAPIVRPQTGLRAAFGSAVARMSKAVESFKTQLAPRLTSPALAKPATAPILSSQPSTTVRTADRQTILRNFLRRRSAAQ